MTVSVATAMNALVEDLQAAYHESIGSIEKIEALTPIETIITVKSEQFRVTLEAIN